MEILLGSKDIPILIFLGTHVYLRNWLKFEPSSVRNGPSGYQTRKKEWDIPAVTRSSPAGVCICVGFHSWGPIGSTEPSPPENQKKKNKRWKGSFLLFQKECSERKKIDRLIRNLGNEV